MYVRMTRIVVCDSHVAVGGALAAALSAQPHLEVVAVVGDVTSLFDTLAGTAADVVVLDVANADEDGVATVRRLRRLPSPPAVMVVTDIDDPAVAVAAVRAGVAAWVPKSLGVDHLIRVVSGVPYGRSWFPPVLLGQVLAHFADAPPSSTATKLATLTPREYDVLLCMVHGLDRLATAKQLFLSANTVRTHVQNLFAKLGVHSQLEAIAFATRAGMVGPAAGHVPVQPQRPVRSLN